MKIRLMNYSLFGGIWRDI